MLKNALNTMKPVHSMNAVDFERLPAGRTFKAGIFQTSLVEEIPKISFQISLVAVAVAPHVKVRIFRLRQRLLFVNQSLEQTLI